MNKQTAVFNKQEVIDKIISIQELPVLKIVSLMKRNIIVRNGPNLATDWMWNMNFLRYYSYEDLLAELEEIKKGN